MSNNDLNIDFEEILIKKNIRFGLIRIKERCIPICTIPGYNDVKPNYWISSYGRVFSTGREIHFIKQTMSLGYMYVMVRATNNDGIDYCRRIRVHRLVMLAFSYFEGCESYEVNHKDGNKTRNRLDNLEWSTRKENMDHAVQNHLAASCENSYRATITNEQAIQICELLSTGEYLCTEIADMTGTSKHLVHGIARRSSWNMISCNYVFRLRVTKSFPNSVVYAIINFINTHCINEYESLRRYVDDILNTIGWQYSTKRDTIEAIVRNPQKYILKLESCEY